MFSLICCFMVKMHYLLWELVYKISISVELWLLFFCFCPKNFWGPQKRFKFWILDLKVCLKKLDIGSGWYGKSVAYLFYYYWPHHFFTFRFVRTGDGSDKSPSNAQCFIFCLCTRQLTMIIFFFRHNVFTTNTN